MSVKVVLATHNQHKVDEFQKILGARLPELEIVRYDGPEPIEDGVTFEANALIKARSPIVFDVELDAAMLLPGLEAWHKRRGNRSILAVPMFIDGKPYGYFGITLCHRAAEVSKASVNLIHALAQQATLAIQLTQLAEVSHGAVAARFRQINVLNTERKDV